MPCAENSQSITELYRTPLHSISCYFPWNVRCFGHFYASGDLEESLRSSPGLPQMLFCISCWNSGTLSSPKGCWAYGCLHTHTQVALPSRPLNKWGYIIRTNRTPMKKTGQVKPHKLARVLPPSLLIPDAGDFYPCLARLQGKRLVWITPTAVMSMPPAALMAHLLAWQKFKPTHGDPLFSENITALLQKDDHSPRPPSSSCSFPAVSSVTGSLPPSS